MTQLESLQTRVEKEFIRKHVLKSTTKQNKAFFDCARQFASSLIYCGIDFDTFLNDYENDLIITNLNVFITTGSKSWIDSINPNYKSLARDLFKLRPTGLGTPNSAVGEGEFMLSCLSPKISKPKKGDIQFNIKPKPIIAEIKNVESRVFAPIGGINFNQKCLELAQEFEFHPNPTKNKLKGKERFGVEFAEKTKKNFYDSQFQKLSLGTRKEILKRWFILTESFTEEEAKESASKCFDVSGKIISEQIQKEILKRFNRKGLETRDEFSVKLFFNEDNLTVIGNDPNVFDHMVDNEIIKPLSSYFRIFQSAAIGWYFKAFI